MPIIYNGVTLTDIVYNGVALDKVIYNGVEVFTKASAIIREPASGEYYVLNNKPYYLFIVFYLSGSQHHNEIGWNSSSTSFVSNAYDLNPFLKAPDGYTYYRGSSIISQNMLPSPPYPPGSFVQRFGIYRIKN